MDIIPGYSEIGGTILIEYWQLLEEKKITIQKRKIKNKLYTSYIVGLPSNAIFMATHKYFRSDKKYGYTALKKMDNRTYEYLLTDELKPGMIALDNVSDENYDKESDDKKSQAYMFTLPKKDINFLQAYDKYIETVNYINNKYNEDFKTDDLIANVLINVAPANAKELQSEIIIQFDMNIDDKLKKYIDSIYEQTPEWYSILNDRTVAYLPETFTNKICKKNTADDDT